MARYVLVRLADSVPTVLLVLTLVFLAMRILPGDPALAVLGDMARPEQIAEFRERMGLNVPLWQQYFNFLHGMLTLDFGSSLINGTPTIRLLAYNLPYTIELTAVAVLMGLVMGVPLRCRLARSLPGWPSHWPWIGHRSDNLREWRYRR
jgi:peptide/nickel transport system permease protein